MGTQYLYVPPDWDQLGAGGSANVSSCTARAMYNGSCVDCTVPRDKPGYPPRCSSVYYSAACGCDSAKCSDGRSSPTSGNCTYVQ